MKPLVRKQQGFSLISAMAGLVVGLMVGATAIGTVTFMEAQKRTSMGSDSALANGGLGLFRLENETRLAGLGLMSRQAFACNSMNLAYMDQVLLDDAPLWPASIVDGGATGSDTLSIAYMNSLTGAAPSLLLLPMASATAAIKLSTSPDAAAGKLLLVQSSQPSSPCTLYGISAQTAAGFGNDIQHDGGDYNTTKYSNPITYLENSRASVSGSFTWSSFRVNNQTLEQVNNITRTAVAIADGVIALKAQYGITAGTTSTAIDSWTSATGAYAAPAAADMLRVRALRVGLAVRSVERDNSCPTTNSVLSLWTNGPTVDISGMTDWRCYKYRTFNMIIPLVNVAMGAR